MELSSYGQNKKRLSPIPSPARPSSPRLDASRCWHYTWKASQPSTGGATAPRFTQPSTGGATTPRNRSCHASCKLNGNVYVFGGKDGNISYKDMWKYNSGHETWELLKCGGDKPFNLQGHSMTPYGQKLYVFGGQFNFGSDKESPFWIFDSDNLVWEKHKLDSDVMTPMGRREHTAVVHKDCLHIYGGYIDLKGSSSELWTFSYQHNMWHLSYCAALAADGPGGRHGHSAVVHDNCMWVFGGMNDLQAKDDLWKWNFDLLRWSKVKSKGPPCLKDHSACVLANKMIIYGGGCDGQTQNQIWAFHFGTQHWSKVNPLGRGPPATVKHSALFISSSDLAASTVGSSADRSVSSPQLQVGGSTPCQALQTRRPFSSPPYVMENGSKLNGRVHTVQEKPQASTHEVDRTQSNKKLTVQFSNPAYDVKSSGKVSSSQPKIHEATNNPWANGGQSGDSALGNKEKAMEMKPLKGKEGLNPRVRKQGRSKGDWGSVGSVARYTDKHCLIDMKKSQTFSDTDSLNSSFGLGANNPTFIQDTQGQFIKLRRSSEVLSDDAPNNSEYPAKRHHFSSQFSDDFVPYHKSASAESILSTHSREPCHDSKNGHLPNGSYTFSEAQAKSRSLGSLNNHFGDCNLSQGMWEWDAEPHSTSRDDLILEDIEDCDVDTIDNSQSFGNSNNGLTLMDCSPEEISQSNSIFQKFGVKQDKRESHSLVKEIPSHCTHQSLICLHDPDSVPSKPVIHNAWAGHIHTKTDSRKVCQTKLAKPEVTAVTQNAYSERSDNSLKPCAPEVNARNCQKSKVPNYKDLFTNKAGGAENKFYLYVIGGKTQEGQNFNIKPLSLWKLEIDIV